MSDSDPGERRPRIELAYELDAAPQKVWRAISIPAFREAWLPADALADPQATAVTPGEAVSYRMREAAPPHLESTVTFRIAPNEAGGTCLRIIHEPADARFDGMTKAAANGNDQTVMLAA